MQTGNIDWSNKFANNSYQRARRFRRRADEQVSNYGLSAGVYEVTYKVTDSQGASYTTTIQVTVNPKMETLNEAPIITATDKTITVGDTFDPKADVTASDKEDGDITANLEVVKNEVDTTKAGVYEVTYKVTDSQA